MSTFTILCEPQEAPLLQQEIADRVRAADPILLGCVKFSSMGGGHVTINLVAGSGVDFNRIKGVFRNIDLMLTNTGFTRTDEGHNCFIYKR